MAKGRVYPKNKGSLYPKSYPKQPAAAARNLSLEPHPKPQKASPNSRRGNEKNSKAHKNYNATI